MRQDNSVSHSLLAFVFGVIIGAMGWHILTTSSCNPAPNHGPPPQAPEQKRERQIDSRPLDDRYTPPPGRPPLNTDKPSDSPGPNDGEFKLPKSGPL
jgi:hypothetical protein